MGTGSSSCSPGRRWRRSRWGRGSGSAPARPTQAEEQEGVEARRSPVQPPPPPLGEPDSDSELLDQVLAECDDPVQLPWTPHRSSRLAGHSSSYSPGGGSGEGDQARGDRQISLARVTPALENSNFTNNLPLKKAERKSKTSYDYSEEEMMAAIEQEYGR